MKPFFSTEGLAKFQQRIAGHISHSAVNCEALCWATLDAAFAGRPRMVLDDMLRQAVPRLCEEPEEMADVLPPCPRLPTSFRGMRDVFFIHFLRRLPIMMHRTRVMYASPRSPGRKEIERACLHCLEHYASVFQAVPMDDGKCLWEQDFRTSWSYLSWYTPADRREEFYYEWDRVSDYLKGQTLEYLEWTIPRYARRESEDTENRYQEKLRQTRMHDQWLLDNQHVFLDQLADHLPGLYLLRKA